MIKKFLFMVSFLFLMIIFNMKSINTIDSKVLIYDNMKPYMESEFNINFYSLNVKDMKKVFDGLDIEILSVKPMNELYFNDEIKVRGNNMNDIVDNLMIDYSEIVKYLGYDDASLYFQINGFNVEKIKIRAMVKDLTKLEDRIDII